MADFNTKMNFDWLFYLGFAFYFINLISVTIDMGLWFRNRRIDNMSRS